MGTLEDWEKQDLKASCIISLIVLGVSAVIFFWVLG